MLLNYVWKGLFTHFNVFFCTYSSPEIKTVFKLFECFTFGQEALIFLFFLHAEY